jgi:uncharacterized protein with HEPN domain
MRNALSHAYFKVDLDAVWRTIQNDLPPMAGRVSNLPASLRDSQP